jgi:para-nitrobenzyl esterase
MGIPFASPPLQELRFQPPEPPPPWSGVRDGSTAGPVCSQALTALERIQGISDADTSEDCLYLNVWTPSLAGSRPVMVWLHGGAFINGAGSLVWYDGSSLAMRSDLVVVSINYRLGVFGYTSLAEQGGERYAGSANLGLLDQIAALRWVGAHASALGGDPRRVCLFGESAGAMSIGALLGAPQSSGLFCAAALQSGACANVSFPEEAARTSSQLFEELGLAPGDLESFVAMPTEALVEAQSKVVARHRIGMPFSPVVDGTVIPEHPLCAIRSGSASGLSLITGSNLDELRLFGLLDPRLRDMDQDDLLARARRILADRAEEVLAVYRSNRPGASPAELWEAVFGDYLFRIPALRLAEAAEQGGGRCWTYLFTWSSDAFNGQLGCCHAMEVPFVFDNLDLPGASVFTGSGAGQAELAVTMRQAWASLARAGLPSSPSLPDWPVYSSEERATMVLGVPARIVEDPDGEERSLWDEQIVERPA